MQMRSAIQLIHFEYFQPVAGSKEGVGEDEQQMSCRSRAVARTQATGEADGTHRLSRGVVEFGSLNICSVDVIREIGASCS